MWLSANKLKWYKDKTEVLLIQSKFHQQLSVESVQIGKTGIVPSSHAWNLWCCLHIWASHCVPCSKSKVPCEEWGQSQEISHWRSAKTYMHAVELSKLDCVNCLLYGGPSSALRPLTCVRNHHPNELWIIEKSNSIYFPGIMLCDFREFPCMYVVLLCAPYPQISYPMPLECAVSPFCLEISMCEL